MRLVFNAAFHWQVYLSTTLSDQAPREGTFVIILRLTKSYLMATSLRKLCHLLVWSARAQDDVMTKYSTFNFQSSWFLQPGSPKTGNYIRVLRYLMTEISPFDLNSARGPCLPKLIGRVLKTRTKYCWKQTTTRFEVNQWHRQRPLIFYFSLFQLGVRVTLLLHSSLYSLTHWILGHIRPFCVLAPRLVREQKNVVVTFMVAPQVLEKVRAEISRQFLDESSDSVEALKRIR